MGGRPTVRKVEISGGKGRLKKRRPVGRKARGNRDGIGGGLSTAHPGQPAGYRAGARV
jgi:hypothetical protein